MVGPMGPVVGASPNPMMHSPMQMSQVVQSGQVPGGYAPQMGQQVPQWWRRKRRTTTNANANQTPSSEFAHYSGYNN